MWRAPYIIWRAPYIRWRAPYIRAPENRCVRIYFLVRAYMIWRAPYIIWRAPYIRWRAPYIRAPENICVRIYFLVRAYIIWRAPYIIWRAPYIRWCAQYIYIYIYIYTRAHLFEDEWGGKLNAKKRKIDIDCQTTPRRRSQRQQVRLHQRTASSQRPQSRRRSQRTVSDCQTDICQTAVAASECSLTKHQRLQSRQGKFIMLIACSRGSTSAIVRQQSLLQFVKG